MNFDTVHEYHFYNSDNTNRIMIEGIKIDTIKSFVNTMNKKQLDENLEDHNHSTDAVEA